MSTLAPIANLTTTTPIHSRDNADRPVASRRCAIDVKTLAMVAMVAMGRGYCTAVKARMPRHWHAVSKHTHVAVDDAIEQGELFMSIVRELNTQFPNRADGSQSA